MTGSEFDPLCGDGSSLQAAYAALQAKCDHICLKDDGHVDRGEPHFYGYENPSPRRTAGSADAPVGAGEAPDPADGQRISGLLAAARWDRTVLCHAIKEALAELGEAGPDYPAPVANAVGILCRALHGVTPDPDYSDGTDG